MEKGITSSRKGGSFRICIALLEKVPKRLDDGTAAHEYPATAEDHFKQIYYEALDLIISCITDRFDQPGYRIYNKVQDLILKAAKQQDYQTELDFIIDYYGDDFDAALLKTHLEFSLLTCCLKVRMQHCLM